MQLSIGIEQQCYFVFDSEWLILLTLLHPRNQQESRINLTPEYALNLQEEDCDSRRQQQAI